MSNFFKYYLVPSALREEVGKDMSFLYDVAYKEKKEKKKH